MTSLDLRSLLIGDSPVMANIRAFIGKVAALPVPVLLEGPTGTGKELAAQALHALSTAGEALVALNVCAIPQPMFESVLFGHTKGAFTGAHADRPGHVAAANGGTLFLDEVGSLPLEMQAKLLRVLETGQYHRLGSTQSFRSRFRVISAINEELDILVRSGRMRRDFAERLSTVVIRMPPLKDRPEDIPQLVEHFIARSPQHAPARPVFTAHALGVLQQYHWPGNVRELRNVVERVLILHDAPEIDAELVLLALESRHISGSSLTDGSSFDRCQRRNGLLALLERFDGDTARVAEELSVARATVYRRMQRLGIPTSRWRGEMSSRALNGTTGSTHGG
ncbi:MAG TPA: sigma-54 dependent transcriptional regulator [Gemmatimonadaceae bacterium]|nr:sigma-54 dependent transcriptional regulator [Gemmatimonadaceae bacterium]